MNIILLSGGSGKRLWPLSNDIRSKQFIKIFKGKDSFESMLQRVYRQIRQVDEQAVITIATSKSQVSAIRNQLGKEVGICAEPCRRDTFPAIALAAAYLTEIQGVDPKEPVIICPVDPFVEEDYFLAFRELEKLVLAGETSIALLGMEPTYPSAKYGYIFPESQERIARVRGFREKPSAELAAKYIEEGALWNGGVFACRPEFILEKAHEQMEFSGYADLYENYEAMTKISFDYAVVEKERKLQVLRFLGTWKDLGTWNTFTEAMEEAVIGKGTLNETCEGVHIINEMDVPILAMGLKDVVIAVSPEGILVSDKEQSSYIKPFVDRMDQQIMFAEKSWGSFKVLEVEKEALTIKVTLNPGHSMHYHSHRHRDEVWVVISGSGRAVIDDREQEIVPGSILTMKAGQRHTVSAETELKIVEVQLGKAISVEDKEVFDR